MRRYKIVTTDEIDDCVHCRWSRGASAINVCLSDQNQFLLYYFKTQRHLGTHLGQASSLSSPFNQPRLFQRRYANPGTMCDKCFYAFLCCFLPCIEKREARRVTTYDSEEAPRSVEMKSKIHGSSCAAVETSSLRRRVSAQLAHYILKANLSQPMTGKQTAALSRLRMAFSTTKEHISPEVSSHP